MNMKRGFSLRRRDSTRSLAAVQEVRRASLQLFIPHHSHSHPHYDPHYNDNDDDQTRPKSELLESSSGDLGSLVNLRRSLSRRVNIF